MKLREPCGSSCKGRASGPTVWDGWEAVEKMFSLQITNFSARRQGCLLQLWAVLSMAPCGTSSTQLATGKRFLQTPTTTVPATGLFSLERFCRDLTCTTHISAALVIASALGSRASDGRRSSNLQSFWASLHPRTVRWDPTEWAKCEAAGLHTICGLQKYLRHSFFHLEVRGVRGLTERSSLAERSSRELFPPVEP